MATRTVSTKLAITGESEYRASLSRINTELKTLQSALKLTESQYQTNANSMEALRAKGKALNDLYTAQKTKVTELRSALDNAKSAEQEYANRKDAIQKKIDENNKALEKLKQTTGDTTKEEAKLTEENAKLQKELTEVDAKMQAAEKGTNSWQTQLNNAEIKLNDLGAEIEKNNRYLEEAEKASDGCATSIDEFGREVDDTAKSVSDLGQLLASSELQDFAASIEEVLTGCVKASMDFESQMAAVKRTTGMSDEELKTLGDRFKTLSTEIPISTESLAKIAETAGQLGIPKENVEQFTVVMAQLATTTDLSAESASTMLAQFANITGIKSTEEYERLGSVVAALGDSTATTASKVVDMSQGMAAAASQAGMSSTDILAISAAVGSLGIEAAAGSTSMSTLISTLYKATQTGGEDLEKFASVAGMTGMQFKAAWETDAVGALNAFITGLNDTERNGESAIMILEDLGITNVRQTKTILGLAEAGDLLTDCIEKGNAAWEENTALSDKAEVMYDTLAAKTEELDNASNNLKIAIGDALNPILGDLAEKGTDILTAVTQFVTDHPKLTEALTLVAAGVTGIVTAFAAFKSAQKVNDILGLTKPLAKLSEAITLAGGGISGLITALGAIAVPAALAATALAGVVAVVDHVNTLNTAGFLGEGHTLEEYAQNARNCAEAVEEWHRVNDEYMNSGFTEGLEMLQSELDVLEAAEKHAKEEYEAFLQTVDEGNTTTATAAEQTANQAAVNEAFTGTLQSIAQSYREAYDACRESLDGQIGLFDNFAKQVDEETDTAIELLQRWGEQTTNLQAYTENLKKAGEYGLDQGLVQSLADGSAQSAGYLATIIAEIESCANGTGTLGTSAEDAVSKFNLAFENTQDAKDHLAATMTTINEDLEASLAEMEEIAAGIKFDGFWDAVDAAFKNAGINFSEIGTNMGLGMQGGLDDSADGVEKSAGALADAAAKAAKDTLGVKSPSTVFKEIGKNVDAGLKQGIESGAAEINASVTQMGNTMVQTMSGSAKQAASAFILTMNELSMSVSAIMVDIGATVQGAMAFLPNNMFYIGVASVDGMINGLFSEAGALYDAMYYIVSEAIQRARSAAAVRSPSRKTMEIFENVGEGMIVGIQSKKEEVEEATADVVNSALVIDPSLIKEMSRTISSAVPDYSRLIGEGPDRSSPISGSGNIITNNIEVNVSTQPGQDNREIADYVLDRMNIELARTQGAY